MIGKTLKNEIPITVYQSIDPEKIHTFSEEELLGLSFPASARNNSLIHRMLKEGRNVISKYYFPTKDLSLSCFISPCSSISDILEI